MTREIVTLKGKTREEKIATAKRVKGEFEREFPELAAARERLVAMGMMDPGFKAIRAVRTDAIDYHVTRDDPDHDERNWAKEPIITEDMIHEREAIQAGKVREARTARYVPEPGKRGRRR